MNNLFTKYQIAWIPAKTIHTITFIYLFKTKKKKENQKIAVCLCVVKIQNEVIFLSQNVKIVRMHERGIHIHII